MGEGIHFSFIRVMKPKCIRANFFYWFSTSKNIFLASKVNSLFITKRPSQKKKILLWFIVESSPKRPPYIKASWPILKCWENVGIENQYSMGHQGKYPVYPVLPTVNTTFDDLRLLELHCTDL